jgi:hypothetical protein
MPHAARTAHNTGMNDSGPPPVVTCAVCRRPECAGCEGKAGAQEIGPVLPWEAAGTWGERLWKMALACSTAPLRTFGELPEGRLGSAFAFAFIAETIAVGSLGAVVAAIAFLASPTLLNRVLLDRAASALIVTACLVLIILLVALHVLWGLCLEAGTATTGGSAQWQLGMRFGLYACGWDLLTSPAGVLQGLLSRGPAAAWNPVGAAAKAPRLAMHAYLANRRQFESRARRRATIISVTTLGIVMAAFVTGLVAGAIHVILAVST